MSTITANGLTVMPSDEPAGLPLADGPPPPLRVDARRNRERVICAAARVIEAHGAAGFTMEAVAAEAGVGKGTVFRRFGDRSSLLLALLDEEERRFQDDVLHGPAPLGPGAPPLERLIAFGDARLTHLFRHGELLAAAEERLGPVTNADQQPAALAARVHLAHLLRLAGHDAETASVLSSALMAFLSGAQVHHLRSVEQHSEQTMRSAWRTLVAGAGQPAGAPAA